MASLPTAAAASSSAPFKHAFERYEQPLIRYAMRIVRDRERARDIVQDTFLRMCESDVEPDDPRLGSWLYTVCRNRAIDVKRREGRISAMETPPEVMVDPSGEHLRAVSEVFQSAGGLPKRKAEVLELRYRQGRSYRQIADETGMTVNHVGVVLHDCIKYLRKNMSVVAAFALLLGAGAWGVASSRAPAPPPSYFTKDRPSLPAIERGELPPVDGEFYGPEQFYGPELPETLERKRVERRSWPIPRPAMPMRSPFVAPEASMEAPQAAPPPKAKPLPNRAKQLAPSSL